MKKILLQLGLVLIIIIDCYSQNAGDYRSAQTGSWGNTSTWQKYNGSTWAASTDVPGYDDFLMAPIGLTSNVTIRSNHTVTASQNIFSDAFADPQPKLIVESDGVLNISSNYIIYGSGGPTNSKFPYISISGKISTVWFINSDTLIISESGRLETSCTHSYQTTGWWVQNLTPNSNVSQINGSVEFNGTTQNIASHLPYNNLEISTTGTVVSGNLTVNDSLWIKTGATLTMPSDVDATIDTLIITDADALSLEVDANMIVTGYMGGTGASSVALHRSITEDAWHLMSVPLSDYTMADMLSENTIDLHNTTNHYALAYFSESSNAWVTSTSPSGNMNPGEGYLVGVSAATDTTLTMTGTPVYGNQTSLISIANTNKGINAVGNPYTSPISVDAFLANAGNIAAINSSYLAMYTYNPTTNAFVPNVGAFGQDYIQSYQGFMLNADADGGNINFTTSMQAFSDDAFYKKSASNLDIPAIDLTASLNDKVSKTKVCFTGTATNGLDPGQDLGMISLNTTCNLYTQLIDDNGLNFTIQSLPDNNFSNMTIPIGVDCKDGGLVTFSAARFNLPDGCEIFFEDKDLDVTTNLKVSESNYTVNLDANTTGFGRFYLHTFDPNVNIYKHDLENITIFAYQKEIIIQGEISEAFTIELFDISGRMVLNKEIESEFSNRISAMMLNDGIYIVRLKTADKEKVTKIMLH